jgi:hypothetical protein
MNRRHVCLGILGKLQSGLAACILSGILHHTDYAGTEVDILACNQSQWSITNPILTKTNPMILPAGPGTYPDCAVRTRAVQHLPAVVNRHTQDRRRVPHQPLAVMLSCRLIVGLGVGVVAGLVLTPAAQFRHAGNWVCLAVTW